MYLECNVPFWPPFQRMMTYLNHTSFRVYIFWRILVSFAKFNTRKIFFWAAFTKINTREICTKIIIGENKYTKINMLKKMFVNSAFFKNQSKQQFFHRDQPVFPLILTETLAECPLIQLSFFSFGQKFINSKFPKTSHSRK